MAEQQGSTPEAGHLYDQEKDNSYTALANEIHGVPAVAESEPLATPEERAQTAREKLASKVVSEKERAVIDKLVRDVKSELTKEEINELEDKKKAETSQKTGNAVVDHKRSSDATRNFEAAKLAMIGEKDANAALSGVDAFLAKSREVGERNYIDIDRARVEADASKMLIDSESDLKFKIEGSGAEAKLEQLTDMSDQAKARAEGVRNLAVEAGRKAGDVFTADQAKNSKLYVKSIGEVAMLVSLTEGKLRPIKAEKPEYTSQLACDIEDNLKIDRSAAPLKVEERGNKLKNNRTTDIYRESTDPTMKGMVFVEQVDSATGEVIRLDIIKAEKPSKETRLRMRGWENKVETQLKEARVNSEFISSHSRDTVFGSGDADGSYAGLLKNRGVSADHFVGSEGKKKLKPKAKNPWWTGLFGLK